MVLLLGLPALALARPRFAEFKSDGSELWVSSEIGGTVSIIDPARHAVTGKIEFSIPGLRREAIQPVGIGITKDGKTAFIALGLVMSVRRCRYVN
jgi:DNA-binding beta-propeller fold protein YncE